MLSSGAEEGGWPALAAQCLPQCRPEAAPPATSGRTDSTGFPQISREAAQWPVCNKFSPTDSPHVCSSAVTRLEERK